MSEQVLTITTNYPFSTSQYKTFIQDNLLLQYNQTSRNDATDIFKHTGHHHWRNQFIDCNLWSIRRIHRFSP